MRALRLCGLTLGVAAAHLAGWRIAVDGWPRVAPARAGIRWIAMGTATSVSPRPTPPAAPAPSAPRLAAADTSTRASPSAGLALDAPASPRTHAAPARSAFTVPSGSPRTGDDGRARRVAPPARSPTPAPTRVPPSATVHYAFVQGGAARPAPPGDATLEWTRGAGGFSLRLAVAPGSGAVREWFSTGAFDTAGVAPERLVERERGRDKRAVNFDRASQRVRFSGATRALPLSPGLQDRWSWIAQLAALAEAASVAPGRGSGARDGPPAPSTGASLRERAGAPPRRIRPGTTWTLQVAGLRGEVDAWAFRVLGDAPLPPEAGVRGNDSSTPAERAPPLLHLVRDPERPYDLRIEAWLSPSLHYLPIGLRMSTPPGSWSFALWPPGPRDDRADPAASDPVDPPGPPASAS